MYPNSVNKNDPNTLNLALNKVVRKLIYLASYEEVKYLYAAYFNNLKYLCHCATCATASS